MLSLPERPWESQANFTLLLHSLGKLDKGFEVFCFCFFLSEDRECVLSEPNTAWQHLFRVCCNDRLVTARGSQMHSVTCNVQTDAPVITNAINLAQIPRRHRAKTRSVVICGFLFYVT